MVDRVSAVILSGRRRRDVQLAAVAVKMRATKAISTPPSALHSDHRRRAGHDADQKRTYAREAAE